MTIALLAPSDLNSWLTYGRQIRRPQRPRQ